MPIDLLAMQQNKYFLRYTLFTIHKSLQLENTTAKREILRGLCCERDF
jgi:hypothetical protein